MRTTLACTMTIAATLAATLAATALAVVAGLAPQTPSSTALIAVTSAPPAGLSVEAKDAPFSKGFEFKFKSGTSTATISIDPLGMSHTDSATISSSGGSISLNGKYDRNDRKIEITARRAGQDIGEFSWRVEAVLR